VVSFFIRKERELKGVIFGEDIIPCFILKCIDGIAGNKVKCLYSTQWKYLTIEK